MLHFEDIDADGVAHCPGWGLDALKYLFEERGVTAVGHETLDTDGSADVRARGFLDCEKYVLESDHYQVEVMANLDKLPSTGGVIFVASRSSTSSRASRPAHGRSCPTRTERGGRPECGSGFSRVQACENMRTHPARRRVTAAEFRL